MLLNLYHLLKKNTTTDTNKKHKDQEKLSLFLTQTLQLLGYLTQLSKIMIKTSFQKIQRNILFVFVVFMVGNLVGSGMGYFFIAEDCAIMSKFRIGRIAYSCQRLAP